MSNSSTGIPVKNTGKNLKKQSTGSETQRHVPPHLQQKKKTPVRRFADAAGTPESTSTLQPPKNQARNENRRRRKAYGDSTRPSNKNTLNKGGPKLKVFYTPDDDIVSTHSFQQLHNECKALRYKVHKPNCECPKVLRLIENRDDIAPRTIEDGRVDALVVVPDTKQKFIYVCKDTESATFFRDPAKAERKLRGEIFPHVSTITESQTASENEVISNPTPALDENKFKLSCASCLLKAHEPNGFCLISSSSSDVVDQVRDNSRYKRDLKETSGQKLHPDHAHFVATIPRSTLWNVHRARTRAQTGQAVDEIFGVLSAQGIDIFSDVERFTNGVELGHHMVSLLALTNRSDDFWLVLGYDDNQSIMLDLPGGKRHLGETSLEGAIRETEEESSLVWDTSWVSEVLESRKRSDGGNRYFVLHPPESFLSRCV